MSDFLVLKSTEVQKEEGAAELVDTAYIIDRDGLPSLRAVFDVQHFKPTEVFISFDDDLLTIQAESFEDTDCSIVKRTLIRKLDLPPNVDGRRMHCDFSATGILSIEMPFHLHPRRCPVSPSGDLDSIVPIVVDDSGRRVFGSVFTSDTTLPRKT